MRFTLMQIALSLLVLIHPASAAAEPDSGTIQLTHVTVEVPVDHDHPDGETYALAAVRAQHPDPFVSASGTPSVFLAGGPGDSGVRVVEGLVESGGVELFRLIGGDLIGFDERGVGASEPDLGGPVPYRVPAADAGRPERILQAIREAHERRAAQLRARGVDFTTIHPEASARDLKIVLDSMGVDRVNLWGRSYGSHLAIAVDRFHPRLVERLVLVGPEGPDQTIKLPAHADAAFARFASAIAEHPEIGDEIPDFLALAERVVRRLDDEPAVARIRVPSQAEPLAVGISGWDVRMLIWNAMSSRRFLAELPALLLEIDGEEYDRAARIIGMQRARMGLQTPMNRIMDLACGVSEGRLALAERQKAGSLLGSVVNFSVLETRGVWEPRHAGDGRPAGATSEAATLLIVGELDPRTPVENIPPLRELFPNSSVITIANAAHQFPLFENNELKRAIARFLSSGEIPDQRLEFPPIPFTSPSR